MAIDTNAAAPAKVATDAGTVEQHKLADQIAYDQYQSAKQAATANARRGFMLSRTRLGGPIGYTDQNADS